MRVIAGSARGRRLQSVEGKKTRPTLSRVKESLFSILGDAAIEGEFLDLYAGSGGMGIEALSRGAPRAVFVEQSRRAARVLRGNLERVGLAARAEVWTTDVVRGLGLLATAGRGFGCVFLDPPYGSDLVGCTLLALGVPLVDLQSVVVAEHSKGEQVPERAGLLVRTDMRVYGDTVLSFFRREP